MSRNLKSDRVQRAARVPMRQPQLQHAASVVVVVVVVVMVVVVVSTSSTSSTSSSGSSSRSSSSSSSNSSRTACINSTSKGGLEYGVRAPVFCGNLREQTGESGFSHNPLET